MKRFVLIFGLWIIIKKIAGIKYVLLELDIFIDHSCCHERRVIYIVLKTWKNDDRLLLYLSRFKSNSSTYFDMIYHMIFSFYGNMQRFFKRVYNISHKSNSAPFKGRLGKAESHKSGISKSPTAVVSIWSFDSE